MRTNEDFIVEAAAIRITVSDHRRGRIKLGDPEDYARRLAEIEAFIGRKN